MQHSTRAIGTMKTAENKRQEPATVKAGNDKTEGPIEGTVQKGRPIGTMTTASDKGIVKDGT